MLYDVDCTIRSCSRVGSRLTHHWDLLRSYTNLERYGKTGVHVSSLSTGSSVELYRPDKSRIGGRQVSPNSAGKAETSRIHHRKRTRLNFAFATSWHFSFFHWRWCYCCNPFQIFKSFCITKMAPSGLAILIGAGPATVRNPHSSRLRRAIYIKRARC